jgi:hypothetical protein
MFFDVLSKHKARGKLSKSRRGKYFYLMRGRNIEQNQT